MIFFSFPLGRCVDEVVDNEKNYQGYKYVYFLCITHWQSSISWIVKEFVRLTGKLFQMHTFV